MDDRTYRRLTFGCSCGYVARSAIAEARHRHNFPLLCRGPRKPASAPTQASRYTKECVCGRLHYTRKRVCECGHVFYKSPRRIHP